MVKYVLIFLYGCYVSSVHVLHLLDVCFRDTTCTAIEKLHVCLSYAFSRSYSLFIKYLCISLLISDIQHCVSVFLCMLIISATVPAVIVSDHQSSSVSISPHHLSSVFITHHRSSSVVITLHSSSVLITYHHS